VGGDIVVESAPATAIANPLLGLWNPATGKVTRLGHDWGVIDAHTGRDGAPSLLAWIPASCDGRPVCPLQITNITNGRTSTISSPLPYGFDVGGAFSPDGSRLAVFVKTNAGDVNPAMELALVDPASGSIRLIPGARGNIGESVGWARWLPDGTQVLTGTFSDDYRVYNHYLLDTTSGAVSKVDFTSDVNRDVNFSASQIGAGG
jgi:WD40 repeat protein